jgi:hypothetical protein
MLNHFKILLLFYLLFGTFLKGRAQDFPSEYWHSGKLVLMSEDTLYGKIKYDLDNDIIQLEQNAVMKTFSAKKIFYFEIFDETVDNYRHFYSLPYRVQQNYEVPIIFEVLFEGNLSLLCREEIVTENIQSYNYNPYYYSPNYGNTRTKLKYNYYFLNKNGDITLYSLKKNDLLRFFKGKEQAINKYMKKNNLKHDRMRDLVRITAYYNALMGS